MQNKFFQTLMAATLATAAGQALAHSAGAVLDAAGNNASATDMAQVICYDDGNGTPHHLYTQIQDLSPPVPGLYLSTQIYTDTQMANATDPVSGDTSPSPVAAVAGGEGPYYVVISKTAAGARTFDFTYHCQTANDTHTGTDISVLQVQ